MAASLKLAAVALILALLIATAAALWDAEGRRTDESLYAAFADALPEPLLAGLEKDVSVHAKIANRQLMHNKMSTNWLPITANTKPRFAVERAIFYLKKMAFPGDSFAKKGIAGAEWWFQSRPEGANIGFHLDKDEAYASQQMRLRYPEVSTITYVRGTGSPTVIFNQTTPDGNDNVPVIPETGALTFPERNKHVIFNGDLMHGVSASLSFLNPRTNAEEERLTFLVNWWTSKPLPPNCITVSDEHLPLFVASSGEMATMDLPEPRQTPMAFSELEPKADDSTFHLILLPPEERFFLMFPNELSQASNHAIRWTNDTALGGVGMLDLDNDNLMGHVWQSRLPKTFIFFSGTLESVEMAGFRALRPVADRFLPFFADVRKTADALTAFGLDARDAPIAVIHDTARDRMYIMPTTFSEANLVRFYEDFLAGNLRPRRARDEL